MRSAHLIICLASTLSAVCFGETHTETAFFPPAHPARKNITVIDMTDANLEEKLTSTTLQGLVNRQDHAELYLLLAQWDSFWLDYIQKEGFIQGYSQIPFSEALATYASLIQTRVIYDPELSASINIATMIAAEQNGIVVSPDNLFQHILPEAKVVDLRKRWSRNAEAYHWAILNLIPHMNTEVLACYHPTACNHHIRDYLVQHKIFHFWASSEQFEELAHINAQDERNVVENILASTPANIPVLGFWYSGADAGLDEYQGVGLAGEYGKVTVVCDWATNLSLLGGISVNLNQSIEQYRENLLVKPPELEQDKIYLCIDIVESGDSPSYVQSRMHTVWQDEKRGNVPINWSLGPAILDLAPPLAHYFYTQATPVDYLYMSISGAGYCHPYRALFSKTSNPDKSWENYMALTQHYQERMRCEAIGLYTDAWKPFDRSTHDAITKRFADGLPDVQAVILGMGRDEGIMPEAANYYLSAHPSTLISHVMTRWPTDYASKTREENIAWLVEDIRSHTPKSRPGFLHVMALSWVFGPSELASVMEQLGPDYVPLTIPQFTALYKSHSTP